MITQSQHPACRRVFHIPELLELILAHLATRDLLLCQRTSRCVRNTIQSSVMLRRKLFLEPDWKLENGLLHDRAALAGNFGHPRRKPDNNYMLLRAPPGCYPTIALVFLNESTDRQTQFPDLSLGAISSRTAAAQWRWELSISCPANGGLAGPGCYDHAEASWRNMYLSQPPCQELYLVRRWQRGLKPAIVRTGGIKMGDLIAEATKPMPECEGIYWHTSYISSDRDWHCEGDVRCGAVEWQEYL